MAGNPIIFDRRAARWRRARVLENSGAHDFLLRRAASDIVARLSEINRNFALAVDLSSTGAFAAAANAFPEGKIGTLVNAAEAERLAQRLPTPALVADEEALAFANGRLSLVVSLLALHRVNDVPGALIQIRRALMPDGLFIGAVFGGETLKELRECFAAAELETTGGVSPRVAPFADLRDLGGLLQRAGFALPVTDVDRATVTYPDARALMRELKGMGESNIMAERRRSFLRRDTLDRVAALYAERFSTPEGRVTATFDIVYLAGWAPHPSQQKPLAPGSARARLADALGTEERSAGEKPRST